MAVKRKQSDLTLAEKVKVIQMLDDQLSQTNIAMQLAVAGVAYFEE